MSIDGELVDASRATVSVFDAAVLHGDSYFETLRVAGGEPRLLDAHLERLRAAIEAAGYAGAPSTSQLRESAMKAIRAAALDDAVLRIAVTRGSRPQMLVGPAASATTIVYVTPLPKSLLDVVSRPARLSVAQCPGYGFPRKSGSYQRNVETLEAARAAGRDEVLICDGDEAIECATANVWAVTGDQLVTPPPGRCLPGVTRAALLAVASTCGLAAVEHRLTVGELRAADAVLITNSLIDARRVASIGDVAVGGERAPALHERVLGALAHAYEQEGA